MSFQKHTKNKHVKTREDFIRVWSQDLYSSDEVEAIFIGGSVAKNLADSFSDVEICLITSTDCSELMTEAWSADCYSGKAYFKEVEEGFNIELRCVHPEFINDIKYRYTIQKDYSPEIQDFLQNFKYGIYLKTSSKIEKIRKSFHYTNEVKEATILNCYQNFRDFGFKMFLSRKDYHIFYDYLNIMYKSLIYLTYAINDHFCIGSKHFKKLQHSLNYWPSIPIEDIEQGFQNPHLFDIHKFLTDVESFILTNSTIKLPKNQYSLPFRERIC